MFKRFAIAISATLATIALGYYARQKHLSLK